MSDQSTGRLGGGIGPQSDTLESRLDALGRSIVEEEARRAEPPSAYLQAAANRAMFVRVRTWTPRLAVAAVLLLLVASAHGPGDTARSTHVRGAVAVERRMQSAVAGAS